MDVGVIEKVLNGIGADRVKVRGRKITCCCVLARWTHQAKRDNSPSMVVYADGDRGPTYGCMACHETGTLIDLLLFLRVKKLDVAEWIQVLDGDRKVENASRSERLYDRAEKAKTLVTSPAEIKHAGAATRVDLGDGRVFYDYLAVAKADQIEAIPESVYEPYVSGAPAYALARGITEDAAIAWQLGDDKGMQRMLFPVRDRRGRLVAISGRLYATTCVKCGGRWSRRCEHCNEFEEEHEEEQGDLVCANGIVFKPMASECVKCGRVQPPKYLHSLGFKRNLMLYGEHMTDKAEDGRVYVVEGNIDVIKLWQHGYRPVVATLGSYPGEPQIEKIVARWSRVIVVGDGDKSGRELFIHTKRMLAGRIPVFVKALDDGRDPGNMSGPELAEKLGSPPTLISS